MPGGSDLRFSAPSPSHLSAVTALFFHHPFVERQSFHLWEGEVKPDGTDITNLWNHKVKKAVEPSLFVISS